MSLLRSIINNRLNQITCLVIPKYPGVIGRRYLSTDEDVEAVEASQDGAPAEGMSSSEAVQGQPEIDYTTLSRDEIYEPGLYFPTLDVFETTYDGVKYEDLPFVKIVMTRNNVKMGAHSADGKKTYGVKTCGTMGFKHAEKRSTVAAQTIGFALGEDMVRRKVKHCRVELYGTTMSRLPAMTGIQQAGINIVSISDKTNHSFFTKPKHAKKK